MILFCCQCREGNHEEEWHQWYAFFPVCARVEKTNETRCVWRKYLWRKKYYKWVIDYGWGYDKWIREANYEYRDQLDKPEEGREYK